MNLERIGIKKTFQTGTAADLLVRTLVVCDGLALQPHHVERIEAAIRFAWEQGFAVGREVKL